MPKTTGKVVTLESGGATGGALADAGLSQLVELWPSLSSTTKKQILAYATKGLKCKE